LVLVGYEVATFDGDVGKVDEATYDPGTAGLVIDPGQKSSAAGYCYPPLGEARRC
jgi:hypothetical protein